MSAIYRFFSRWLTPVPSNDLDIASVGFSLGLASLALGQALQSGRGFITWPAILWLTISLICLIYTLDVNRKPLQGVLRKISIPILILGLAWQVFQLETTLPGVDLLAASLSTLWFYKLSVAIAACLALISMALGYKVFVSWQNTLVISTLIFLWFSGVWVIKASPKPFGDVFVFHQMSSEALLHGQNPYTLTPPNIFGHMRFYGAELVKNGKLTIGNPYPPLSIYFSTLGYILGGDIRYSHLLAILLAGALIAFLHSGREAKLAAYLFLFTPQVFFVLEQSWTEPIITLCLVTTVYFAARNSRWLPVALGLLFASKQYLLFVIPLTLLLNLPKSTWRNRIHGYGLMGGVMVAVTAPLALWNLPAFLWDVGEAQWYQVFRMDALSYLALYAHLFEQTPPQFISFIALGIAIILVWRFASRTVTGFAISFAWCLAIFFAFNKQAFCNYYFLVIGAICCAFASLTTERQIALAEDKFSGQQQTN